MTARLVIILALAVTTAFGDVTVDTTVDADVDDAACSLREAIIAANTNASYHGCVRSATTVDTIGFDLGTGTPTITVTDSDLPGISGVTIVDGAVGDATRVEIAGGGTRSTGLAIAGDGSVVRNLVINGFTGRQLFMSNGSGIVVEGNLIGTNAAGSAFVAGSANGIDICAGFGCGASDGHQIGGPTAAQRNVIVANGVGIQVPSSSAHVIQGNFFNTDVTATTSLNPGNTTAIAISNAVGIVIGGADPGEGNVITALRGVIIGGNPALIQSNGTVVQGNLIGTDVTGTVDLGGSDDGVTVAHAINTQIGGLAAGAGNIISGWVQGVTGGSSGVSGAQVDDTTVQGNLIGTNAAGTGALGNSGRGVALGDDAVIQGNVIAFNGGDGIEVACFDCFQRIEGNAIHSNGGLGIDLGGSSDGVTPNDPGDADGGANGLQNFPILDPVEFPGGTSLSGELDSTASTTFRVEIFASDACDPTGNGEGQKLVGVQTDVTTDGAGHSDFTVTLSENVAAGKIMTATATAPDGSTSEFSPCTPTPPSTTTSTSTTTTTSSSTTPTTVVATTTTTSSTTSTSSSSSTTTAPAATSTSSTLPVVTTTSTSTSLATTTSTLATTCGDVPDGPTFFSIGCRLDALVARLTAETTLEQLGPKLIQNVDKARTRNAEAETLCRDANARKTKKRLQQTAKALLQYAHRLNGRAARRRIDATLRQGLVDQAAPIQEDARTLRASVSCPTDAP